MKMETNHISSFDYLRAIAIIGIMMCHFLFNWYLTVGVGRFFGCTFNALFIGISGLLLGMKWHASGKKELSFGYLKHRLGKLARSYYPFLVLMFLFLTFVDGYSINITNVVTHFLFLPWINKLPGFEHLWFMTMIAVCYVAIYILSKLKHIGVGRKSYVVISVIVCAIHALLLTKGLPGQLFLYLWFFILCFYHANEIRIWIEHTLPKNGFCMVIGGLVTIIFMFYFGVYNSYRLVGEWLGVLAAVLVAILVLSIFRNAKNNVIISFLADISFEIYLVHHVIAFGKWSVTSYFGNPFLGFLVYVFCSIMMAFFLRKVNYAMFQIIKLSKV